MIDRQNKTDEELRKPETTGKGRLRKRIRERRNDYDSQRGNQILNFFANMNVLNRIGVQTVFNHVKDKKYRSFQLTNANDLFLLFPNSFQSFTQKKIKFNFGNGKC